MAEVYEKQLAWREFAIKQAQEKKREEERESEAQLTFQPQFFTKKTGSATRNGNSAQVIEPRTSSRTEHTQNNFVARYQRARTQRRAADDRVGWHNAGEKKLLQQQRQSDLQNAMGDGTYQNDRSSLQRIILASMEASATAQEAPSFDATVRNIVANNTSRSGLARSPLRSDRESSRERAAGQTELRNGGQTGNAVDSTNGRQAQVDASNPNPPTPPTATSSAVAASASPSSSSSTAAGATSSSPGATGTDAAAAARAAAPALTNDSPRSSSGGKAKPGADPMASVVDTRDMIHIDEAEKQEQAAVAKAIKREQLRWDRERERLLRCIELQQEDMNQKGVAVHDKAAEIAQEFVRTVGVFEQRLTETETGILSEMSVMREVMESQLGISASAVTSPLAQTATETLPDRVERIEQTMQDMNSKLDTLIQGVRELSVAMRNPNGKSPAK